MGMYEKLRKMLGLDEGEDRSKLDALGMEPLPPERGAAYVGVSGEVQPALDRQAAEFEYKNRVVPIRDRMRTMERDERFNALIDQLKGESKARANGAADTQLWHAATRGYPDPIEQGGDTTGDSMAKGGDTSGDTGIFLKETSPERNAEFMALERLAKGSESTNAPNVSDVMIGSDFLAGARKLDEGRAAQQPAPVKRMPARTGASIAQKEQLADAFKRAGVNPEESAEGEATQQIADNAAEENAEQQQKRRPLGFTGPMQAEKPNAVPAQGESEEAYRARALDPNRRIFDKEGLMAMGGKSQGGGDSGGALGSLSKTLMGSADPRFENLKKSMAERDRLLVQADAEHEGGVGADIAGNTHFNASAGAGTRQRAEAVLDSAMKQLEQRRAEGDYESRQATQAQQRQFAGTEEQRRISAEGRAQNEETRRQSEEERRQKTFETKSATSDPNSDVSKNARAELESLYGDAWKKIPEAVRNKFTADDVDRFFKEAQQQKAGKTAAGQLSLAQQEVKERFIEKQAQAAKLNSPKLVGAMNDVLATLDTGMTPGSGHFLNKPGGWSSFLRSPEGNEFRQVVSGIANTYLKEISGATVTDSELDRIMTELGQGQFDDPELVASGMRRLGAALEDNQAQALERLIPEARQRLEERGAVRHVDSKKGKVIKGTPRGTYTSEADPAQGLTDNERLVLGILGGGASTIMGAPGMILGGGLKALIGK